MYNSYISYIRDVVQRRDLSNFKSNPNYTAILEHVNPSQGEQYLHEIKRITSLNMEDIRAFCSFNDRVGSPNKTTYVDMSLSPSSLRYILHAHLILTHLKSLASPRNDIVEVGGGYGGLCLALHWFAPKYGVPIHSYSIIDLREATDLQRLYLEAVQPGIRVNFHVASEFGADVAPAPNGLFLVSNYCFSEISPEFQEKYRTTLFPKVAHGFMAWNMIPVYEFGFPCKVEEEVPKTGPFNRYVYF